MVCAGTTVLHNNLCFLEILSNCFQEPGLTERSNQPKILRIFWISLELDQNVVTKSRFLHISSKILQEAAFTTSKEILLEMGHFFQVQDDYLDCFGDPAITGKIGTDIEDNKCGWVINKALLICTPEQRQTLEEHYAKKDPESVRYENFIIMYCFYNIGFTFETL